MASELISREALLAEYDRVHIGPPGGARKLMEDAPTVDAVEVDKYIELREQYDRLFTEFHELRDAFVDYVCSGIPNPSPFCKNKRHGCCDSYGWCKHNDQCTGFNPVEWFSDGERKDK